MIAREKGICLICGKEADLTFEHIPPQATGNTRKVLEYSGFNMLECNSNGTLNTQGIRYKQNPRGAGSYALCGDCNSYVGAKYVKTYSDFINNTRDLFESIKFEHGANSIQVVTDKLNPLAFFKQCISIFACTTQEGSMLDCKEFLLDCNSTSFNKDKYRLRLVAIPKETTYIKSTGWYRLIYDNGLCSGEIAEYMEYPIGMILYKLDAPCQEIGVDITNLSELPYDSKPTIELVLPYMEFPSIIPGDIRSVTY